MNIEEWKEQYGVVEEPGVIDMDDLEEMAEIKDESVDEEWRRADGDSILKGDGKPERACRESHPADGGRIP